MQYEQLSNTLTFVRQRKDASNLLLRLAAEMETAPEVPTFRMIGPLRTRVRRRAFIKLIFVDARRATLAVEWIKANFDSSK